jgi:hypothetical protein
MDEFVLDFYAFVELEIEIPVTESMRKHERMEKRHIAHREIKHRMYAERVARRAKKGAMING